MSYFEEIIFDPKPKVTHLFVSRYWFEFLGTEAQFMVRCPVCAKVYCYASVRSATRFQLIDDIKDNEVFFMQEWAMMCPDASIHSELLNVARSV